MCSLVKPTELREVWSLICYSFKVHQTDEPFYKPCSKRVLKKYRKKKTMLFIEGLDKIVMKHLASSDRDLKKRSLQIKICLEMLSGI